MSTEPIDRPWSRVILIGPDGSTLLMRGGDPARPGDGTWWYPKELSEVLSGLGARRYPTEPWAWED